MAFQLGALNLNGALENLVFYRLPGVDNVVVRRKGRVSKERYKYGDEFSSVRRNNAEWNASIQMGRSIQSATNAVRFMADYNYTGSLNARCKNIQKDDKISDWGQRSVLLSISRKKLEGFNFNKFNTFDSIVKLPLECMVDRATGTAGITISPLTPGLHLNNPKKQPLFQFKFALASVQDMVYDTAGQRFPKAHDTMYRTKEQTAWYSFKKEFPETKIHLGIDNWVPADNLSLVLSVGIIFGVADEEGKVSAVKYSGAGKILRVF